MSHGRGFCRFDQNAGMALVGDNGGWAFTRGMQYCLVDVPMAISVSYDDIVYGNEGITTDCRNITNCEHFI